MIFLIPVLTCKRLKTDFCECAAVLADSVLIAHWCLRELLLSSFLTYSLMDVRPDPLLRP